MTYTGHDIECVLNNTETQMRTATLYATDRRVLLSNRNRDVNKDSRCKAKARTKDLIIKLKARTKDFTFKAFCHLWKEPETSKNEPNQNPGFTKYRTEPREEPNRSRTQKCRGSYSVRSVHEMVGRTFTHFAVSEKFSLYFG